MAPTGSSKERMMAPNGSSKENIQENIHPPASSQRQASVKPASSQRQANRDAPLTKPDQTKPKKSANQTNRNKPSERPSKRMNPTEYQPIVLSGVRVPCMHQYTRDMVMDDRKCEVTATRYCVCTSYRVSSILCTIHHSIE